MPEKAVRHQKLGELENSGGIIMAKKKVKKKEPCKPC